MQPRVLQKQIKHFSTWRVYGLCREISRSILLALLHLFYLPHDRPWDIDRFLKNQCRHLKLDIPHYFQRWVNVRKHFNNFYKIHQVNVDAMLTNLGLTFVGRPHSGIDDSRNIARIMIELIRDGGEIVINETFRWRQ